MCFAGLLANWFRWRSACSPRGGASGAGRPAAVAAISAVAKDPRPVGQQGEGEKWCDVCAWAEGSLCHQLSWRQMRCMQHLSSRQRIERLIRPNRAHRHSFSIAWGFQNAWVFSANDKPVPSMAYAAAPCVMDPLHGPKRAAAAAQLEDVVRALLAQSAASGRLRMTRQRVAGPWQMH